MTDEPMQFEDPFESDTEPNTDSAPVETETKAEPFEEVCQLPNSGHLYRQKNAAGGYTYWSDEVGGGVLVWDTCMVGEDTLLCAMTEEMRRRHWEAVARREGVTVEQLKERVRRQNEG